MLSEITDLGLFLISFLAATILPFSSEAYLLGHLQLFPDDSIKALILCTTGNSLGSLFNYYLGRLGKVEWYEKYLKVKHEKVLEWQDRIEKYGSILAFFCWTPIIGDFLAVALGFFRLHSLKFFTAMALGKFLRYYTIIYFADLLGDLI